MAPTLVVVGAGVVGLTTALVLSRRGYEVIVVARHLPGCKLAVLRCLVSPPNCTLIDSDMEETFERTTYRILWDIASSHPESGVCKMDCVQYLDTPLRESGLLRDGQNGFWYEDVVHNVMVSFYRYSHQFREIPTEELPQGMQSGISLTSLSINPQIYLFYLQSQLLSVRTRFIRRHLNHIREAFHVITPAPLAVVNATGLLSCKLGGVEDSNVYPTRGQTILVRNTCSKMYFDSSRRLGEEATYIIPRPFGGGTVLGGCRQANNWKEEVDHDLARRIASRCVALAPELTEGKGIDALDIVRHNVGLRPSRHGGPRVEAEMMAEAGLIVHNYGASGAGYQSSWGMALQAADLMEKSLQSNQNV